jgi:hypothetical protein
LVVEMLEAIDAKIRTHDGLVGEIVDGVYCLTP